MVLHYSYINMLQNIGIPERSVNGGLYTGEPFQQGAPWANIPVVPDADTYTQNLESANPPPDAIFVPSYTRPGNNTVNQYLHEPYGEQYNFMCRKSS